MAKRSVLILIIALISGIMLSSCNKTENVNQNDSSQSVEIGKSNINSESDKPIFTMWIYPIGVSTETYQISLLEDNILQVNMGERENSKFSPLTKVIIESRKDLGDLDYGIINWIDEIYKDESIKSDFTECCDVWMVEFSYKDKNIIQPCYEYTSTELEQLYEFLIELSPIEIDMRGFA